MVESRKRKKSESPPGFEMETRKRKASASLSKPDAASSSKVKVAPLKDQQISTISTTPSEIPKRLYDLIQKVAKLNESVKLNSNNRDEDKFYKLDKEYIFYMTIEAIEQGIPGVYTTKVECKTKDGARTLLNFELTDRKPKWNRPWVKPHLESEVEYETVEG
ncbi:hypothetical protein Tco_1556902 [Tanacetum coccineum]